jgi:hypothetical protein
MALPEGGIVLGSETTDFYLTIPAGKYPDGRSLSTPESVAGPALCNDAGTRRPAQIRKNLT